MSEVGTIGNHFLAENQDMEELSLPKVKTIGNDCLSYNRKLKKIFMPEVETIDEALLPNFNSNVKNRMMVKK